MPVTGLSGLRPSLTAYVKMDPNKPTVLRAVPSPPVTRAFPRSFVFSTVAVLPSRTSCMNFSTSFFATSSDPHLAEQGFDVTIDPPSINFQRRRLLGLAAIGNLAGDGIAHVVVAQLH